MFAIKIFSGQGLVNCLDIWPGFYFLHNCESLAFNEILWICLRLFFLKIKSAKKRKCVEFLSLQFNKKLNHQINFLLH